LRGGGSAPANEFRSDVRIADLGVLACTTSPRRCCRRAVSVNYNSSRPLSRVLCPLRPSIRDCSCLQPQAANPGLCGVGPTSPAIVRRSGRPRTHGPLHRGLQHIRGNQRVPPGYATHRRTHRHCRHRECCAGARACPLVRSTRRPSLHRSPSVRGTRGIPGGRGRQGSRV